MSFFSKTSIKLRDYFFQRNFIIVLQIDLTLSYLLEIRSWTHIIILVYFSNFLLGLRNLYHLIKRYFFVILCLDLKVFLPIFKVILNLFSMAKKLSILTIFQLLFIDLTRLRDFYLINCLGFFRNFYQGFGGIFS